MGTRIAALADLYTSLDWHLSENVVICILDNYQYSTSQADNFRLYIFIPFVHVIFKVVIGIAGSLEVSSISDTKQMLEKFFKNLVFYITVIYCYIDIL